ncbi:MAG: shikimate kinase [Actinomycetaceae bacterium]|nr:shikimate kinase [Actinomycetaceae bacterium]
MTTSPMGEGGAPDFVSDTPNDPEATPALVLIGVSGSGKSTIARLLGDRTNAPILDIDNLVAKHLGAPIGELVVTNNPHLTDTRQATAHNALTTPHAIVALGASQVFDQDIAAALAQARARGTVIVELTADTAEVARRMGLNAPRSVGLGAPRAALTHMIAQHRAVCATITDLRVDTCAVPPKQVAEAVVRACKLAGGQLFSE